MMGFSLFFVVVRGKWNLCAETEIFALKIKFLR